jgi:hypothetical protein
VRHGRRRFRLARAGFVLAIIGVVRLARAARSHWRVSLALGGLLLEITGHSVFTGQVRSAVDLLGLFLILTAALRSTDPAAERRPTLPQAAWRWHG